MRMKYALSYVLRERDQIERRFWEKIVFTRLVNDAQLPMFFGVNIRQYFIKLAQFQRRFVTAIVQADSKLMFSHGYVSK
jgi:hypothetical protein